LSFEVCPTVASSEKPQLYYLENVDQCMKIFQILAESALLFLAVLSLAASGQNLIKSTDPPDKHQVDKLDVDKLQVEAPLLDGTIQDIVARALESVGTPGGIAVRQYCGGIQYYSVKPADSSLSALLDAAVSVEPGYNWTVDNGVVNFIPHYDQSLFLWTKVTKLEIKDVVTLNAALSELFALPEVAKAGRFGNRLVGSTQSYPYGRVDGNCGSTDQGKESTCRLSAMPEPEKRRFSLRLANVTVLEALNAIARLHGRAVWVLVDHQHCGAADEQKFFTLDFVNVSIFGEPK
jgi:hypothetical protein